MAAAEDIIIPPYENHVAALALSCNPMDANEPKDLSWVADMTKGLKAKPTLVPTGIKCKLEPGTYLELSVRSSSPLKYWLILANGVGIIDADYYNNPDNEGHIYFQLINLSPFPIKIQKGEAIGQGIIHRYETTEDDKASGLREGGFGSTTK
jgi:dUTP pyrophosphatase